MEWEQAVSLFVEYFTEPSAQHPPSLELVQALDRIRAKEETSRLFDAWFFDELQERLSNNTLAHLKASFATLAPRLDQDDPGNEHA
jgi:hypothetical protein